MRPHLSIVIPTHQRPQYLARVLKYYAQTDLPVYVADSSLHVSSAAAGMPNVAYHHLPGVPFLEKVRSIMPLITTPFMAFCADDDFIVPRAGKQCTEFLVANPDYSSAQGHYVMAMPTGSAVELSTGYPGNFQVRVDSDDARERLLQIFSPYVQNFYAVHRTDTWRAFYALETEKIPHYCVLELLGAMLAAVMGKHKVLPLFYSVRDRYLDEDRKNPLRRENIDIVSSRAEYAGEYEVFMSSLAGGLRQRQGLSEEDARAAVQASVDLFVSGTLRATPRRPFLKKLPKYVDRVLGAFSSQRCKATKRHEADTQRRQEFERFFDAFDTEAHAELEQIVQAIMAFQSKG